MDSRKNELLAEVIHCYVREAEPVGSRALEGALGVSSATIRNEMAELESEGYLRQPYTSAGRVPTLKGYKFYIDNLLNINEPKPEEQGSLQDIVKSYQNNHDIMLKNLAKTIAEFTGQATIVGFSPEDVYYTGLTNLFSQPEFSHIDMVISMSRVIDHLAQGMTKLYRKVDGIKKVEVCLGESNPFGEDSALLLTHCSTVRGHELIGILGPLRMDYDSNIGRLQYVRSILN